LNEEKYRYQCAVRQMIAWRVEWGKDKMDKYLAEHQFDKGFLADVVDQWMKGNRGNKGEWL
jgi:hypothetical protein